MPDKLKELILYIAERSEGDPGFGATKLNKLLFFSDFRMYERTGKAITGERYQKLEHGPAPQRLIPLVEEMRRNEEAAMAERYVAGCKQKRLMALREPNLEEFSGLEVALVDQVLDEFHGRTATYMSDYSHEFMGWKLAAIGDDIPYETVWVSQQEPSREDLEYAKTIAARCKTGTGP